MGRNTENQTKSLFLKRIVDVCVIILISLSVLSFYEIDWSSVHTSKENLLALHFDMFGLYYSLAAMLFMFILPNALEFFSGRRIMYRYTSGKKIPAGLGRALKIIFVSLFIVFCSVSFADKYSRTEFYSDGSIIEYNRYNQIVNEYSKADIESVELRTNHDFGRNMNYWTETVIYIKDGYYILTQGDYLAPDDYEVNPETERSLYGLRKVKETFSDKIKINKEKLDTLFEVERYSYTQAQAKELCDIFEADYEEMMLWLKEEWDIVLDNQESR
ncbi:MAG: hypothetical protein IJN88_00965 [Clostridia bacterium]|nr:hypothetical protein [Clostridia bacterium]